MSSSISSSLTFAGQQVIIYLGRFIIIIGVVGGLLIAVVFLSLQAFRQSSCAFYLLIMSAANIDQMIDGFAIDWSLTSIFYCKFRFIVSKYASISMTCICLATIDQYLATCSRPRWQQWSNIKLVHRLSTIFIFIWLLHNVTYLVYANHVVSITITGKIT